MRCLVIRFSSLGDIVLTTPVVESLAAADAEIHFATSARYAEVVDRFPHPVILHAFSGGGVGDLLAFAASFRDLHFDLVIDLHANWRSRVLIHCLDARRVCTYPRDTARRWSMVYLKRGVGRARHVVERYLRPLDAAQIPIITSTPRLVVDPQLAAVTAKKLAAEGWSPERPTVGIGWGARWPVKQAPATLWDDLLARVRGPTPPACFIFAPAADALEVTDFLTRHGRTNAFAVVARPLGEVLAAIGQCRAFVSSDSGLMHAAAALGVPTFGVFGPTHPALGFAPRGPASQAIHSGVFCSPCSRHGRAPCYRGHRFCFDQIDVDSLAHRVHECLRGSAPR